MPLSIQRDTCPVYIRIGNPFQMIGIVKETILQVLGKKKIPRSVNNKIYVE